MPLYTQFSARQSCAHDGDGEGRKRGDKKRVGLRTSIPPVKRYQCHPGNEGRDTDHKSGKRRAATEVLGIFIARRDDDEECRLCDGAIVRER